MARLMDFADLVKVLLTALFYLAAFAGAAGTLLGFLGRHAWFLDLFSHFRVQYLLLLGMCALAFLLLQQPYAAAAAGLLGLLNLAVILPLYFGEPAAGIPSARAATPTYKVLAANVLQPNREFSRVAELIQSENPDLVLLVEVNLAWMEALSPALVSYPYRLEAMREDHYGLALLSRIPFQPGEACHFGAALLPTLVAELHLNGARLTVIGAHPPPPKGGANAAYRDKQLAGIAEFAASQAGAVMLLGDLNISPWSPIFQDMLRIGGLVESRRGFGVQASWPVDNPLLRVPIDHALVSPCVKVHQRKVGPPVGSDHFPLIIEFSVPSNP